MSEQFDPYHRWLGIPPKEQPPNHYRLLGVELFESNRDVIDSVATRHMSYLQEITDGPHVREAQRLLNELSAARRCLLDPQKKASYDAELRAKYGGDRKPPKATKPAASPAPPRTSRESPITVTGTAPQPATRARFGNRERQSAATKRKKKPPTYLIAGGIAVVAVVLIAVAGLLWSGGGNGTDEAERAERPAKQAAPEVRAEKPPEPPVPVETESPLAEIADKVPLDVTTPAVSADNDSPDTWDGMAKDQPPEKLPAPEVTSDRGPAGVAGLLLWLDASDDSTVTVNDDALIARWSDKSGRRYKAEADDERRPEHVHGVLSERPVVRFSGSQCLDTDGKSIQFGSDSEYTFVFVARGNTGTLLSKGNGSSDGSFAMLDGVASFHAGDEDLKAADDDGEDFRVRCIVGDHESFRWYIDGRPSSSYSEENHGIRTNSRVRIGAFLKHGQGLQRFFVGELAELLVYNRPLADDERQSIEAHLQQKWLPGDVPPPMPIAETEMPLPKEADEEAPDLMDEPEEVASEDMESTLSDETEEDEQEPSEQTEEFALFVNLGGEGFEDPDGNTWVESKEFDGVTFGHEGGRTVKSADDDNPGTGTAVRGLTAFRAVVPNGDYKVSFFFREHWTTDPMRRVFSVFVEQRPVLRPRNVFHAPGFGQVYHHVIPKTSVDDGRLDVDFSPATPDASTILNGISIQQIR